MARMDFAATPPAAATQPHWDLGELALVPRHAQACGPWSIDEEPIGETWHDSSWMLSKGLQVIEDFAPVAWPHAWPASRWNDGQFDSGFPLLRLVDLG